MNNPWARPVQTILDWIDENIEGDVSLQEMSRRIGYSPYYCSNLFHRIVGMTLKSYVAGRRLSFAALALRDTDQRILDIALRFGFSSQEALTRAFVRAYGCTPYTYRNAPRPIRLAIRQVVLHPGNHDSGGMSMSELREPEVRFEYIPAHKYIGIWDIRADNYGEFWQYHDCDEVCGIIESMRHVAHEAVGSHMAGWFTENGKKGYFYGFGVATDYDGPIPEGFEARDIPASVYLVFFHPPFDYVTENGEVMGRVESLAWNHDPKAPYKWWIPGGYRWNDACPAYQRHFPEVLGYEVLRPVVKL